MPEWGDMNWLAILVAVIASQAIGFLWYSVLFNKMWTAAVGLGPAEMGNPAPALTVGLLASIVQAIGLAIIIQQLDEQTLANGVKIGLLAGVAFAASVVVTNAMFEYRKKALMWLYSGYQVVSFLAMGLIIGAWN
ncbi:MAG: DUF1761 domain-containing protein [Actinomycetota bacterium]